MTRESFFGSTDTGRMRENNEDAFIAQTTDGGRYILACVIDGVGGYEGGEVAAAIAKETLIAQLTSIKNPAEQIKKAVIHANDRIYEYRLSHPEQGNMACVLTMVLADLSQNQFYYAHVGDTRLYLLRDDTLVKVSKDHSFVGFLEDNQKLSEQEAMSHPKRNEINKALGFDPNMASVADYIETGLSPFLPGDLLMLCSDGLTDLVDNSSIKNFLVSGSSLSEKTKLLIDAANAAGGKDNITVVVVVNDKKPAKQKATKPLALKKNENTGAAEPQERPVTTTPLPKRTNIPALLLFILCLILATALIYVWYNKPGAPKTSDPVVAVAAIRNAGEQRLLDSIRTRKPVVLDSTYPSSILISDTVFIEGDSLVIRGNGITLEGDSLLNGPLLYAGNQTRYILLQDLVIRDAPIGLAVQKGSLQLKNVRFINCPVPVQYQFHLLENASWNGRVIDTLLFRQDTLQKMEP